VTNERSDTLPVLSPEHAAVETITPGIGRSPP